MDEPIVLHPSSVARRIACPGSRAMEQKYRRSQETESAREGRMAHLIAHQLLSINAGGTLNVRELLIPGSWPHDLNVTEEMVESATVYVGHVVDTIKNLKTGFPNDLIVNIEKETDLTDINPNCVGTPDCWIYSVPKKEVHLWDYKYGHTPVE